MSLLAPLFGQGNRRGVMSMILGMMLFVANDTLIKLAGEHTSLGQVLLVRGIVANVLILLLAWSNGLLPQLGLVLQKIVIGRGILDLLASVLYLAALFHMPIANISAIGMTSPLALTAVAAIVLRESVGWRRWTAVVCGFGGVLLIVQPSAEGFNVWSLVALGSVVFIVARDMITRQVSLGIPSLIVTLGTSVLVMLGGGIMTVAEGWQPMNLHSVALLCCAACFLIGGYQMVIDAMRHGDLSLVSPFRYVALIFSLLFGYLIWGDWPNMLAWIGIVVVVGSGLYVLHRERVRRLEQRQKLR
ncbi:DMT family transporter [Ferrovibrio sp.]|uniref:DMT family transporter n=1 Tax=Ferrovibrio sp. TaxID=1917215 RepID=UPI003D284DD0